MVSIGGSGSLVDYISVICTGSLNQPVSIVVIGSAIIFLSTSISASAVLPLPLLRGRYSFEEGTLQPRKTEMPDIGGHPLPPRKTLGFVGLGFPLGRTTVRGVGTGVLAVSAAAAIFGF
jgi:hypothetical protein